MLLKRLTFSLALFTVLAACEVEPSAPGNPPVLSILEKRADGTTRLAYTNDPALRPVRTACADGQLPFGFQTRPDTPETWNEFYVLEPGQTEVTFLMIAVSASGVVEWNMSIEEDFAVIDPAAPVLPFGATVVSFNEPGPLLSATTREMTLERSTQFARAA
ncbi:MAG: hypothetical protein ABJC64_01860, partial [Paracoccaceae bacterium]